ncbi:hypothetical protein AB0N06_33935 [Streptomyces sp. NPDC051020]|uniref:hypothetical protein n=1 Tax=Streptomyces sp. NPDC051020 TaxID=3155409 RepID=UPI00343216EC
MFSYEDAIREHVLVESALDNVGDGKHDMIAADNIRPNETELSIKLPVITDVSSYFSTLGRGSESQLKKYD